MKNKWLLTYILILLSSQTFASEYIACGEKTEDTEQNCFTCGKTCTARLDDNGVLKISGTGSTDNYWGPREPWSTKEISPKLKKVIVEEGINNLGVEFLCNGNYINLTEVILPESLKTIGWASFFSVPNLKSIIIPQNTKPADDAFDGFNGIFFCAEGQENNCTQNADNRGNSKLGTYKKNEDGTITCWRDDKENNIRYYYDPKGMLLKSHKQNTDGSVSIYDKNGKLMTIQGKKIYTVEEATSITKNWDKNTFTIRYR